MLEEIEFLHLKNVCQSFIWISNFPIFIYTPRYFSTEIQICSMNITNINNQIEYYGSVIVILTINQISKESVFSSVIAYLITDHDGVICFTKEIYCFRFFFRKRSVRSNKNTNFTIRNIWEPPIDYPSYRSVFWQLLSDKVVGICCTKVDMHRTSFSMGQFKDSVINSCNCVLLIFRRMNSW